MNALFKGLVGVAILAASEPSFATFVAVGKFEGWVCKGLFVELCEYKTVTNPVSEKGVHVMPVEYPDSRISEHNPNGFCFVETKKLTIFLTESGEQIKPDHIRFKCEKQ